MTLILQVDAFSHGNFVKDFRESPDKSQRKFLLIYFSLSLVQGKNNGVQRISTHTGGPLNPVQNCNLICFDCRLKVTKCVVFLVEKFTFGPILMRLSSFFVPLIRFVFLNKQI